MDLIQTIFVDFVIRRLHNESVKEPFHVFFCINDKYAPYLCVTLVSILENNKAIDFNFHVLSSDLSDTSKTMLAKLGKQYKNFEIDYAVPDVSLFKGLRVHKDFISVEAYYRYVIADMFPNIKSGLYLDVDLIVNGDISELQNIDLEGFYAGGVGDCIEDENYDYKFKIGLAKEDLFINSGVILFNLDLIRKDGMVKRLFEVEPVNYHDQDGINIAFRGKIKKMSSIYNYQNYAERELHFRKAKIIHYIGRRKPWKNEHKNLLSLRALFSPFAVWNIYYNKNQKIQSRN